MSRNKHRHNGRHAPPPRPAMGTVPATWAPQFSYRVMGDTTRITFGEDDKAHTAVLVPTNTVIEFATMFQATIAGILAAKGKAEPAQEQPDGAR